MMAEKYVTNVGRNIKMKAIHRAKQRSNQHKRKYGNSKKGNGFRFFGCRKQGFKSVKGGARL